MGETLKSIQNIFLAIKKCRIEKTAQTKAFKARQDNIYNEGLIVFKLKEQFAEIEHNFDDPDVNTVLLEVDERAYPFAKDVFNSSATRCTVTQLTDRQFILERSDIGV